jgi:hypothetical protein
MGGGLFLIRSHLVVLSRFRGIQGNIEAVLEADPVIELAHLITMLC